MSLSTALDSVARLVNFRRRKDSVTRSGPPAAGHSPDSGSGIIPQFPADLPANPNRIASLAPLTETLSGYLGAADVKRIKEAYRFSDEAHLGQFRSSGDAYISHPIAVAEICAAMKLDANAIMAALLHDVIEDQGIKKEVLLERFGGQVAELVDGLSKLDKIEFRDSQEAQAENFRKMLLAMSRDVRVILIKLADRLHNMRTLGSLATDKRRRIARETLEIYTPIAHRLGLNAMYRELQDLAFANLYPKRFEVLKKAILAARGNRREVVGKTLEAVRGALPAAGLQAEVFGREKTIYGVYRKMQERKLSFSQVLDVYGFRIVVEDHASCYLTLGALHALFKPVTGKFKDYIAIPKINGYQSLHTTVLGPFGTPVEFQIRTQEMHRIAESGVAAHWLYRASEESLSEMQKNTHQWLQSLLDIQNQTGDSAEFLEHIKVDLFPDAVYVFTPKTKIITLPRGATPVDFAYQIHTDIGNTCIAAKINGQLSPLRTELQSGDVVEVVTSVESRPNPSWLNFVRTGRARSEIRHYLKTVKYEESVDLGARLLDQALKQIDHRYEDLTDADWHRVQYETGAKSREEVLADLGLGRRIPAVVARRFILSGLGNDSENASSEPSKHPVLVSGTEGISVMLAPCCRPIPGDSVFGYIRRGYGLVVHTTDCPTANRQRTRDPERWVDAQWEKDIDQSRLFDVKLDVFLRNERGILAKTAVEVSEAGANVSHVSMDDEAEEITLLHFMVQVSDRAHLARLIRRLRHIPAVTRIVRVKS